MRIIFIDITRCSATPREQVDTVYFPLHVCLYHRATERLNSVALLRYLSHRERNDMKITRRLVFNKI